MKRLFPLFLLLLLVSCASPQSEYSSEATPEENFQVLSNQYDAEAEEINIIIDNFRVEKNKTKKVDFYKEFNLSYDQKDEYFSSFLEFVQSNQSALQSSSIDSAAWDSKLQKQLSLMEKSKGEMESFYKTTINITPGYWEEMPLHYYITNEDECGDYESRRIRRAFSELQEATNDSVRFEELNETLLLDTQPDINLSCSFIKDCYELGSGQDELNGNFYVWETICEHAVGIANITNYDGETIRKAHIELIGLDGFQETKHTGASGFYVGNCGQTNVEIHEILHTFGYGHVDDPNSIMYYAEDSKGYVYQNEGQCEGSKREIDPNIVEDLILVYRDGKQREIPALNWNFAIEEEKKPEKTPDEVTLYVRGKDWKIVADLESFEEVKIDDPALSSFFAKERFGPKYIYLEALGSYHPNLSSSAECREAEFDGYQDYRIKVLDNLGEKNTPENEIKTEEYNGTALYTFDTIYRYAGENNKLNRTHFKNMDAFVQQDDYCFEFNMIDFDYHGDSSKFYEIIDTIKVVPAEVPPEGKNVYSKDKYDLD